MLTLRIGANTYHIERLEGGFWRLTKPDGTTYDCGRDIDGRPVCDCPDHHWRHRGLDYHGCKHVASLTEHGILPTVRAVAPADC
jgi:hypothetical protein